MLGAGAVKEEFVAGGDTEVTGAGRARRDRRGRRRGVDGVGRWRSGSGTGRRERRRPGCRRRTCRSGHPSSYVPTRLSRCAAGARFPARSFREGSFHQGRLSRTAPSKVPGRMVATTARTSNGASRERGQIRPSTSARHIANVGSVRRPPHHTIPPSVHRDSIMRDSDDAKPPGSQAAACRRPSRTRKPELSVSVPLTCEPYIAHRGQLACSRANSSLVSHTCACCSTSVRSWPVG
ncbi:hypothetical protein SMICM304S_03714 [Streptomyces microflavus]